MRIAAVQIKMQWVLRQSCLGLQRPLCILNSFWYLNIYYSYKSKCISSNYVTFICACITIKKKVT